MKSRVFEEFDKFMDDISEKNEQFSKQMNRLKVVQTNKKLMPQIINADKTKLEEMDEETASEMSFMSVSSTMSISR